MPILPAEPDLHPSDLWKEGGEGRNAANARWWCLHTKPRQEKAVARLLRFQDIAYYLPQAVKVERTPRGRKTRSLIPLFPGYLFLLGPDSARTEAVRTNRLVQVLDVVDQENLVRELRQIHRMLTSGLPVLPEPALPVGSRVRITSGPLTGIEGVILRHGKRDQFVAVVHFLGRGATVDLEDWQVEPVDESETYSRRA